MRRCDERLGEMRKNKDSLGGYKMKIVEYNSANDIWIEFQDDYKTKVPTRYSVFVKGEIRNPYHKSVFNVGYLGQGKYEVSDKNKHTKEYKTWVDLIRRCYDPYFLNRYPTYINCYVCDEWLNFQNFAKWYEENYYEIEGETMCLDKDILYKNNKIYSPETCVFVPNNINVLFCKRDKARGDCPIGVYFDKERCKFVAKCSIYDREKGRSKGKFIGRYDTQEEAFFFYKQFKEKHIKQIAKEYRDLIPSKLYFAMCNYQVEIND